MNTAHCGEVLYIYKNEPFDIIHKFCLRSCFALNWSFFNVFLNSWQKYIQNNKISRFFTALNFLGIRIFFSIPVFQNVHYWNLRFLDPWLFPDTRIWILGALSGFSKVHSIWNHYVMGNFQPQKISGKNTVQDLLFPLNDLFRGHSLKSIFRLVF